jgi:uncharacterized protein (DUF362 family)
MHIHPLLRDPNAVLIVQAPTSQPVAWEDYRQAALLAMIAMHIELEGERVVIKPNLTSGEHFANPDTGITTHPGFVQGMVEYLMGHGGKSGRITIVEDPRNTNNNTPRSWVGTGYEHVAQDTGARLHCPTSYTCVKKPVLHPLIFERVNVSRLAVAPNTVLFNVPKLKTHNLSITTLGLKNLMGLVNVFDRHFCAQAWVDLPEEARQDLRPRREWFDQALHARWQEGLSRRLADTAQVIRPALNIVEGIVGREGTGFQRGRNRTLGLAVAGVNLVAVDSLASYLMGFDPQCLTYLNIAASAGLGVNDIQKLRIYILDAGKLTLCPDVRAFRIDPPFQVLTGIMGEDPDIFRSGDAAGTDPVDRRAARSDDFG